MQKFIAMLKDSKYQENLTFALLFSIVLCSIFNCYLDFKEIKHERIVKVVSLGFIVFSYLWVLWKF